jgi:hypothetical protein
MTDKLPVNSKWECINELDVSCGAMVVLIGYTGSGDPVMEWRCSGAVNVFKEYRWDDYFKPWQEELLIESSGWHDVSSIPRDGTVVDVWCHDPRAEGQDRGIRFTDVRMRGDGSGFGVIIYTKGGITWEYLEREDGAFPRWSITHWMHVPQEPRND